MKRVKDMDGFEDLFITIVHCLEKMKINKDSKCNRDTTVKSSSFFTLVSTVQFNACLVLIRSVLDMMLPVAQLLQSKSIDICDAFLKKVALS